MSKRPASKPHVPDLYTWLNQHAWLTGVDLTTEHSQAIDEGRDLGPLEKEFERLQAVPAAAEPWRNILGNKRDAQWLADASALLDAVQLRPIRKDFPYHEPSDLPSILAARPKQPRLPKWHGSKPEFLRRLHGGLLGRICGCLLGKPIEGWDQNSMRVAAAATGNWPLTNYWAIPTPAQAKVIAKQKPKRLMKADWSWKALMRGHIDGMVEDDDTNYTTIGFGVVAKHGAKFTPIDVASFWGNNVPIFHTCTAERVAYRNFVSLVPPAQWATHRNPYREWIGAQIRADYFGYANPANPVRAADWTWRDASISHIKNGIYGEMWVAAMLAAAYVESDWVKILRAGLAQIPAKCRLTEAIEQIITTHASGATYEDATQLIRTRWDEANGHHWCHTISNAQIVALALLYGEDDYEKTITRAVMPGFDTDCNGATAGSLWGIVHGVDALPKKWTAPIRDHIRTGVDGYHDVPVSKLAKDMVETALKSK